MKFSPRLLLPLPVALSQTRVVSTHAQQLIQTNQGDGLEDKKFSSVILSEIGTTTHSLSKLDRGTVMPTYGAGLRFTVAAKERLKLRMDYARGNENGYFYFGLNETF